MSGMERMEAVMKGLGRLPTLPGIALKILEVVKKRETSLKDIGDILSKDPPLSAEVLKLINSSFYGLSTKVSNVSHAVKLMGIDAVKNLALSFSLVKNNRKEKSDGIDYAQFWKESLIAALTTKSLAQEIQPAFSEDAFFLGLLHNIGILALMQSMPEQYSLVLQEKERSLCAYHEVENQLLGFNHMQVGEYLAASWGLPETLSKPIRFHHHPDELNTQNTNLATMTKILHLSSLFTDFLSFPDKGFHLSLIERTAKSYGFFNRFKIEDLAEKIQAQTREIFPVFEIKVEEEKTYTDMIDEARKEVINISNDIMTRMIQQKQQIELLRQQAAHDGLTSLINYQNFQELLEKELNRAKRYSLYLSLMIADIDYFKHINDTYGHPAGDQVLKAVAQTLKNSLRAPDIVARYGGEEFAILLPETPLEGALLVAERLRAAIESLQVVYEGKKIGVTMSFGIASNSPVMDVHNLDFVKTADQALYQAKNNGRNRCCHLPTPAERLRAAV